MPKSPTLVNGYQTILVVGLGNPGKEFINTRHNVGFQCVDYLAESYGVTFNAEKKKSILGMKSFPKDELNLLLLKPQTYNGLSGDSVLYIASFYQVNIKNVFIVYDDIEMDLSQIRYTRLSKEVIFHNGVRHLTSVLPNDSFYKVGIGVGPILEGETKEDFYLSEFKPEENTILEQTFEQVKTKLSEYTKSSLLQAKPS